MGISLTPHYHFHPLHRHLDISANPTKWSNTLKEFVGNLPRNHLSVFDHFVGLGLKGLMKCCLIDIDISDEEQFSLKARDLIFS